MKNKILSIFMAMVMVVLLLPTAAFAARGEAKTGHNHTTDGYCSVCEQGTASEEAGDMASEGENPEAESVVYIGETGYASLKAAVQAADYGATLVLASNISMTGSVTIDKEITLDGAGYYEISRDFSGDALFNIADGGHLILKNIVMDGSDDTYQGFSLINILENGRVTIETSVTLRNSSADYGGAVYVMQGGTLVMNSGNINKCSAENSGGAVYNEGSVTVTGDSNISGNEAYWGGGIFTAGSITLDGTIYIRSNMDYDGYENNIHVEAADLLYLKSDLYGSVGVNTNNEGNGEGQVIGYADMPVEGVQNIVYDYNTTYFAKFLEDNTIALTDGQSETPSYSVNFYLQSEVLYDPDSQTVEEGGYVSAPYVGEWSGYTFDGWYEGGSEIPFDFDNTQVYNDIDLYGRWSEVLTEPDTLASYTISFIVQAEPLANPETQTVTEGEYASAPAVGEWPGHTFEGWYEEYAEYPFDFDNTQIYNNVMLYGRWSEIQTEPTTYTVSFSTQTDAVYDPETQTVTEGGYAYTPLVGEWPGHTFEGWYEEYAEYPFDFDNTQIYNDVVLYGKWSEVSHAVSFSTQTDAVYDPETQTVTEGGYAYAPSVGEWPGHTFEGWYEEYAEYPFDFENTQIYNDVVLYGKWSEVSYAVSFNTQTEEVYDPETQTVTEGGYAYAPSVDAWEGHTFEGWYEEYAEYPFDFENTQIYSDVALYGSWTEDPAVTHSVTFYLQSDVLADPEDQTINDGEYAAAPSVGEWEGYTFNGWYEAEAAYPFDFENTQIYNDVVLYGSWTENPTEAPTDPQPDPVVTHSVTFYLQSDALADPEVQTINDGEYAAAPSVGEWEGHTFNGWYEAEAEYPFDFANTQVYSDIVLYGSWTENPTEAPTETPTEAPTEPPTAATYVVTFVSTRGTAPDKQTVEENQKVTRPADPEAEGYIFGGWYTDEACTRAYDFNAPVKEYLILYAKWTEQPTVPESYSITFYSERGEIPAGQLVERNKLVEKPADPVAKGYIFGGWYTDIECTKAYDFNTPVTANMTLFAKWTEEPTTIEYFNVTFYSSHGTIPQAQTVEKDQHIVKPADPEAEGFVFGGWFTDQECTNAYDFNSTVNSNMTLFAKWTQLPSQNYIVSFNANGHGNTPNPQTVKTGQLVTKPASPTAVGYVFEGWYTDPSCSIAFNFAAPVNANMTLYAGWAPNRYTVKFDSNGGTGIMQSKSLVYDTKENLPANVFTRTGYYFTGWNTKADGTGDYYADQSTVYNLTAVSGGNVDLYAQWKNIYTIIDGVNAKVQKGTSAALTFRTDGDYSKFKGIRIDGNNVASSQYTSWSGSTYVQLKQEFLNQIPAGQHTIRFEYTDGSVETSFEVIGQTPRTGDVNNMLIWIIIAIAALIIIIVIILVILGRRRKYDDYDD